MCVCVRGLGVLLLVAPAVSLHGLVLVLEVVLSTMSWVSSLYSLDEADYCRESL